MFYSPLPPEIVFQEADLPANRQKKIIRYGEIDVEVELVEAGEFQVNRIISTNPQDFLLPELQPGARLQVKW